MRFRSIKLSFLFVASISCVATCGLAQEGKATRFSKEASPQIKFPEPVMAIRNEVVIKEDFSKPFKLEKGTWLKRQGTRWNVAEGVLQGQQSSPEFQAKREHHFGYEPRLSIPLTPPEFVASFSFRFVEGKETSIVPFIEFGHHVCRVRFSKEGTTLLSDGETMKLQEDKSFIWASGKWYHATAEMKGKEFVIQIVEGPTFYAERDSFAAAPTSGGNGFGIAGPKKGKVELDNMSIWSVKSEVSTTWAKTKSSFPEFTPVQIKEPKKKKEKSKKGTNKKKAKSEKKQ